MAKVGTFRMRTGGGYVSVSNDMAAFRYLVLFLRDTHAETHEHARAHANVHAHTHMLKYTRYLCLSVCLLL